jgi:glycosyltransferase involved in cell wall biosynthesis
LHLIPTLGHGGAEHQLVLAVTSLPGRFESVVVRLGGAGPLAKRLREAGIQAIDLGFEPRFVETPRMVQAVVRVIDNVRPDLVHTSLFEADVVGAIAGRLRRRPVVGTLCNIGGESERLVDNPRNTRWKLRLSTEVWGAALRHGHLHSMAISHAVAASAVRTYRLDPSRVSVVYRAAPRHDRGTPLVGPLPTGSPLLLTVGRLAPQKGQRYLIEALPSVVARYPRAHLAVVGEGWLGQDLLDRARTLGVGDAVSLLGRREDVPALLDRADLFVFPSIFEGLGVSLLQAAAAGVPCIASAVGPIPEILDETRGWLVPPRDPAALSRAILDALGRPAEAAARARAARDYVRSTFSAQRMIDGFVDVYDRVLRSNPA